MVVTYYPRLPAILALVAKHWRAMIREDPYLKDVFPKPPLIAYRKQKTTGDKIIRAKLPAKQTRNQRTLPGMHKCRKFGRECATCPWVKEGKLAISTNSRFKKEISSHLTCKSKNIIYLIECSKCKLQYIGETDCLLQDRFNEHKGYVRTRKFNQRTGAHFIYLDTRSVIWW